MGCWDDGGGGHGDFLVAVVIGLNGVVKAGWGCAVVYPTAPMINGKAFVSIIKMVILERRAVPNKGIAVLPDEDIADANCIGES